MTDTFAIDVTRLRGIGREQVADADELNELFTG
jgi:hypothetical protein